MANKRSLKCMINLVCEELLIECVAASLYGNEKNKDNAEALMFSILKLQSNFICRVSHPEPGMSARQYYKDLREKFVAAVSEKEDQVHNL